LKERKNIYHLQLQHKKTTCNNCNEIERIFCYQTFFRLDFCLSMHIQYFLSHQGEKEIRWSKQISRWSLRVAWRMAKIRRTLLLHGPPSLSFSLSLTHTHTHTLSNLSWKTRAAYTVQTATPGKTTKTRLQPGKKATTCFFVETYFIFQ
jgi:hypothetical protein